MKNLSTTTMTFAAAAATQASNEIAFDLYAALQGDQAAVDNYLGCQAIAALVDTHGAGNVTVRVVFADAAQRGCLTGQIIRTLGFDRVIVADCI